MYKGISRDFIHHFRTIRYLCDKLQKMSLLVKVIVFLCLVHLGTAALTNNIKLNAEEIQVDADTRLLIPCIYSMNQHFQADKVDLEWTMIPESGGDSKPVYMLFDNNKEPSQQPNERAHSLLARHKGDCSLVINPTQLEDSGTYRVHLLINGERFSSMKDVKVHVKTCIESYGADYCMCDAVQVGNKPGLDNKTMFIIFGSVSGGLILLAFVGCLIRTLMYRRKKQEKGPREIEEGRE